MSHDMPRNRAVDQNKRIAASPEVTLVSRATLVKTVTLGFALNVFAESAFASRAHCETVSDTTSEDTEKAPAQVDLSNTRPAGVQDDGSVLLQANEVTLYETGEWQLDGDVSIQSEQYQARSDAALLNERTNEFQLNGDVSIESPLVEISGDYAEFSLEQSELLVSNAEFVSPTSGLRGSANKVAQQAYTLNVDSGRFTSCPPEDDAWAIVADDIELDYEAGFGEAKHTRLEIQGVPVAYFPWFSFPIDERRKSGFLYPSMGTADTGKGLFISTPYYENIAPNLDATLTPSYIGGRGLHGHLELRHLSNWALSELQLSGIGSDNYYEEESATSNNGQRWGLQFDQSYFAGSENWFGKLSFSDVSDNQYLDDLDQGLQTGNTNELDRHLRVGYSAQSWMWEVELQQYVLLEDELDASDKPYSKLPESTLNYDTRLGLLHWSGESQYSYFYRTNKSDELGNNVHGSRLRHRSKFELPFRNSWSSFSAAVSLDHTDYALEDYTPVDNHQSRTLPIVEIDGSLIFEKPLKLFGKSYRNELVPRWYAVYSDFEDQNHLPNFDSESLSFSYRRLFTPDRYSGGDRISDTQRNVFALSSHWFDPQTNERLFSASIAHQFYLDDEQVNLNNSRLREEGDGELAWDSDAKLFRAGTGLIYAQSSGLWNYAEGKTIESYSTVSYRTDDYGIVANIGHRYRRGDAEQIESSFISPLDEKYSLLGQWRFDLTEHSSLGSLVGLEYNSCCWRAQILARRQLDDDGMQNGVLFRVELKGLGGTGANRNALEQLIPGYARREAYLAP